MNLNKVILLLLISFFSSPTFAGNDCLDSLDAIVRGDEVKEEKLQDFLKLQSELTLHKLSYALLKNSKKDGFRVENKILNLLEQMKSEKESDENFKRIYELFENPNNKLSRTALAEVLPYVSNILNEQNKELDPGKRALLNLGESDIKMLAILFEKEKKDELGNYAHLLSKNKNSNNSILNFTKIINSSIRNTNSDKESILTVIQKRLKEVQKKAQELLEEILVGANCNNKKISCDLDHSESIIPEMNLVSILKAVDKVDSLDKQKYLRYDDVWLHTKRSTNKQRKQRSKASRVKKEVVKAISNEDFVHDYLIDHVLDHMPYFLTREELKADKSLTLSLAQAIDLGNLAKKGEERVFIYKGTKYIIPELWNENYTGNRLSKKFWKAIDDVDSFFTGDDYVVPQGNGVKDSEKESFIDMWQNKKEHKNQKYAFSFKGKLFSIETGKLIAPTKESLLSIKAKDQTITEIDFHEDKLKDMTIEIKNGKRSYIKGNKAFHISGVEVKLDKEYARAKKKYNEGNAQANKEVKTLEFPKLDDVKSFIAKNPSMKSNISKALADRDKGVASGDKLVNLITLKVVTNGEASKIVDDYREKFYLPSSSNLNKSTAFINRNAQAVLNGKDYFYVDNKKYDTRTAIEKSSNRRISSSSKGYLPHSEVIRLRDEINSQKNEVDKIKMYHKNFEQKCSEYTVIDKNRSLFTVYSNTGQIIFEKEALIGSKEGDERTLYRDNEGKDTNNKTGAGIYFIGDNILNLYKPEFEGNALSLNTQNKNSRLSISQISTSTPQRMFLFNDNDPTNNRVTNGGVVLQKEDMKEFIKNFSKKDCPLYVLPETNSAEFLLSENQLVFKPKCKNCDKNFNIKTPTVEPKQIKAYIVDDRYKSELSERFVAALVAEKEDMLPLLGITNEEYDELMKLSFGILGVESDFATSKLYKFKETEIGQAGIDVLRDDRIFVSPISLPLSPFTINPVKSLFGDNANNSRGPTQIKHVDDYLKGRYKKMVTTGTLDNPKNAAIATMFVLANKLKSLKNIEKNHPNITSANRMEYLYYLYMGSTDQIKNKAATPKLNSKTLEVLSYSKGLVIDTKY